MTKDLTEGSPIRLILGFSIPVLFGYLFQQFYNLTDTVIVGKFLGVSSLAAVGSTGPVCFLIIGGCMGICSGFAIPVSQRFGAKEYGAMRQYVAESVKLTVVIAAIVTTLASVFCRPILSLMQTPPDVIEGAYDYLIVLLIGIPASLAYNFFAAMIRSLGDSKTPLFFLIFSSVLNIFLDLYCILSLRMGVEGAAIATVASQAVSALACFFFVKKKFPILRLSKGDWKGDARKTRVLLGMGLPMGLQYSITAIGSVILQASVNTLGSAAVAAVTAANRIGMFFTCTYDAMGTTMSTYGGQNTGAGKFDRLDAGVGACTVLSLVYSVLIFVVMLLFGRSLAVLFLDRNESAIIENVHTFLVINSAFYFALALVIIFRFMIQGMGFSRTALFAGVFELVGRTLIAVIFVPIVGYQAVCFASPVAWIFADLFLIPVYFLCKRRLAKHYQSN